MLISTTFSHPPPPPPLHIQIYVDFILNSIHIKNLALIFAIHGGSWPIHWGHTLELAHSDF